jgi:hypothetical protein
MFTLDILYDLPIAGRGCRRHFERGRLRTPRGRRRDLRDVCVSEERLTVVATVACTAHER